MTPDEKRDAIDSIADGWGEALDEIERLRTAAVQASATIKGMADEIERLRAENAKLVREVQPQLHSTVSEATPPSHPGGCGCRFIAGEHYKRTCPNCIARSNDPTDDQ